MKLGAWETPPGEVSGEVGVTGQADGFEKATDPGLQTGSDTVTAMVKVMVMPMRLVMLDLILGGAEVLGSLDEIDGAGCYHSQGDAYGAGDGGGLAWGRVAAIGAGRGAARGSGYSRTLSGAWYGEGRGDAEGRGLRSKNGFGPGGGSGAGNGDGNWRDGGLA